MPPDGQSERPPARPPLPRLPEIPGGWDERTIAVGDDALVVRLPADPDAFLDDPPTIAEHERTQYMPYWSYLWPAAVAMAERVRAADWPVRQRVLEIGCGIGLVGLAALARGDIVTFSDYRSEAVTLSLHNAEQNGFQNCEGLVLDWRRPVDRRFEVILGCEVVYERQNHGLVLDVLDAMLATDGTGWIADAGRHQADLFVADAQARGWSAALYDSHGAPVTELVAGSFRLIELRRSRD